METFDDLKLVPALQKAIKEMGFEKPSEIQAQALPVLLGEDTDFIGLAATGTGKTVAFSLPMLSRIDPSVKAVQAIILCPTRELSLQVSGQVNLLGKYLGVESLPIYGGAGYSEQLSGLRRGLPVVVGTPGRIIDHIERGTLKLDQVKVVILDEADEMISMGFREDMETILETVNKETSNTWLFSATMSPAVRRVADDFLTNPKTVQINRGEMLSSTVEQVFYQTQEKNKPEVLCKLIDAADEFYGIIFCQTKQLVVTLTQYLNERGYKTDCLHGDMSQAARETAVKGFRDRRTKVIVCTDVASRGLDVKDVTHVINYSLPRELDSYVHRIGRTARSGKSGVAMSLVTPSHRHLLKAIERMTRSQFTEGVIPSRKTIGMKKIAAMLPQFMEQSAYSKALDLMDESWKTSVAGMTGEEVAARFLSISFPWVFSDKPEVKLDRPERVERSSDDRDSRGPRRYGRRDEGGYGRRDEGGYGRRDEGGDRGDRRAPRYGRPERSEGGYQRRDDFEGGGSRFRSSGPSAGPGPAPAPVKSFERSEVSERPVSRSWDKPESAPRFKRDESESRIQREESSERPKRYRSGEVRSEGTSTAGRAGAKAERASKPIDPRFAKFDKRTEGKRSESAPRKGGFPKKKDSFPKRSYTNSHQ